MVDEALRLLLLERPYSESRMQDVFAGREELLARLLAYVSVARC
jgi:hypothetical protein